MNQDPTQVLQELTTILARNISNKITPELILGITLQLKTKLENESKEATYG